MSRLDLTECIGLKQSLIDMVCSQNHHYCMPLTQQLRTHTHTVSSFQRCKTAKIQPRNQIKLSRNSCRHEICRTQQNADDLSYIQLANPHAYTKLQGAAEQNADMCMWCTPRGVSQRKGRRNTEKITGFATLHSSLREGQILTRTNCMPQT